VTRWLEKAKKSWNPAPCETVRSLGVTETMNIVAITMVYNEGATLARWLRHYGSHLGLSNLLLVDHGSDDGSTRDVDGAGIIRLPRSNFDDIQRADFISELQRDLLRYYDAVVYTDCDEIIVPAPAHFSNLRTYIEEMTEECVRPIGIDLLHVRSSEPRLDPLRPVLKQRHFGMFRSVLCKPLITKTPIRWLPGFHHCDKFVLPDPNLVLFHTKSADYESALQRLKITRTMPWSPRALELGIGAHARSTDEQVTNAQFEEPGRMLKSKGAQEFAGFGSEIEEFRNQLSLIQGFYRCPAFAGQVYKIPDRFSDTF
jgi:hypothetical protein